jgi:penicillin amidase
VLKIIRRFLNRLLLLAVATLIVGMATAWTLLDRSLPPLDGTIAPGFLAADVTIRRDALGIPTITAADRSDLAFASGFVHGQDRFFQMDLMRRQAAGELAALFGEIALGVDRRMRFHRFRSRAQAAVGSASEYELKTIEAYAAGVNAGLASLRSRPFEYFLLRETPRPWLPEDSFLVAFAMFLDLNDGRAQRDVQRGLAKRAMLPEVFAWLYPEGTRWDAPLTGTLRKAASIPGAELIRLDTDAHAMDGLPDRDWPPETPLPGSNNWAVAGSLSRNGHAIVADDMHLTLSTPNVFYRMRLVQTGDEARDIAGVSLPGTPAIVAGSNRFVAWAFTNSYGDWSDAVILRPGSAPSTYLTPDGDAAFEEYRESIAVKGGVDDTLVIRETRWGPVLDDVHWPDGELAVSWIAHKPGAVNLLNLELETATTVDEAMNIANRLGIPPQNFVCGDADGNIGWTIAGRIPLRSGVDTDSPVDWSSLDGWRGWLPSADYPRLKNPPSGRIWTANARVIDGDSLKKIGDGGYDLGARAAQIRDKLFASDMFDAKDMLAIQLDDRALFLTPWRDLLISVLDDDSIRGNAQRTLYRELVENWVPRASIDSVGYRLVREFRNEVRGMVFEMLMQPVRTTYKEKIDLLISNQFEGPLWALVSEQPPHLLSQNFNSWHALLLEAVERNIADLERNQQGGLQQRSWGERNTAAIRHPLSKSIAGGVFARWLDMPRDPLNGDSNMPRVASPNFGPSERFAVSPGDEENGYMHMPTGQSGHPLSEYYRAGHEDWVRGRATPFLPGAAVHTLVLQSSVLP